MIENQLDGSDGVGLRTFERNRDKLDQQINHHHHSASLSLSPKRASEIQSNQITQKQISSSRKKFDSISKNSTCTDVKQAAASNKNITSNVNRSLAPTDIDEQDLYENVIARRMSSSIGEKSYSQSDEEEGYRSSKEIRQKVCSCYTKEVSPGFSSNNLYDVVKLQGRHNTDKTISTCISYKTVSNRQSNYTNYNTSSSNHLNQRNSSQINSYFSHINSNTSQSPQDTSPLDSAVLNCQLQNLQNNCRDSCNGDSIPKYYPTPFSLDQNYNDKQLMNCDIEKNSPQKSPIFIDQQNQVNSINMNGYNKGSFQNTLLYLNSPYQNSPQSDKSCNQQYCQCMISGKMYNNCNNMGCNTNLHRIKEEAESDTYSIYSYSVRLRHTPPQQNNEDRKVSKNSTIQSKVAAARHILRQSQNSDNINNLKLSNHTSPKNQLQKEDSKHSQINPSAEENIYFYTTDERLLSQSIQIDFQKQPQINHQHSSVQQPLKLDVKLNEDNQQSKMSYLKVPNIKNDLIMEGRIFKDCEKSQNLGISQDIKFVNQDQAHNLKIKQQSQVSECKEIATSLKIKGQDLELNQQIKESQPQNESKQIISVQQILEVNIQNQPQISNKQEQDKMELSQQFTQKQILKNHFVENQQEQSQQFQIDQQSEMNQSDFISKNPGSESIQQQVTQLSDQLITLNKENSNGNTLEDSSKNQKDQQEQNNSLDHNNEENLLPPQLNQTSSSLLKKNPFLIQLLNDETSWNDCDLEYENIKQLVITTSQKLLQKKSLAQKYPVFQRIDENYPDKQSFAALSQANVNAQFSPSKHKLSQDSQYFVNLLKGQSYSPTGQNNDLPTNQQSKLGGQQNGQTPYSNRGYSQKFSLGSPTSYVSNIDNMIYHIFSTPQKSLSEVLKEIDSQDVICAEQLSKKIPGLIDRWKRKNVFLYLDRFCYQENKNSPISTISFKHFDVQVIKDNFRNQFTLVELNSKKKYSFKCQDAEQTQFWVQTIADIIIFNQMFPKYKLYAENTFLYQKRQICFPHDIQSTLFTGDLVIYRTINPKTQKPEKKQEVALIIRTQYMLQVCYYSEEEGILTYPFDTFLMLHNLASFTFRRFERTKETSENLSDENLTQNCVLFISQNAFKKLKDSNSLIYDILKECNVLKDKSPIKILNEREIYETNRLNLYTQNCKYSEVIYLVLKSHICSVTSNPQLLNSIFTENSMSKGNESGAVQFPKILIDGFSPNSNMNNLRAQSVRHFPHCSSMYQHQEQQNEEVNSSLGSNNKLFGRFSYIEYGKDYIRNSYNSSSMKYL